MRDEFKAELTLYVKGGDVTSAIELVSGEYEFQCPAWVMAGPGHQSKHECEYKRPHPIESEHSDFNTEWEGTSSYEMAEQPWEFRQIGPEDMNIEIGGSWTSVDGYLWRRTADAWETKGPDKRKLVNVKHRNAGCGCS